MKKYYKLLLILSILTALAFIDMVSASQLVVDLNSTNSTESYILESAPAGTHDGEAVIKWGSNNGGAAGYGVRSLLNYSYVCKLLPSIGTTINGVAISFNQIEYQGAGTLGVYEITTYWDEKVTWNRQPAINSTSVVKSYYNPAGVGYDNVSIEASSFQKQCQCIWNLSNCSNGYMFKTPEINDMNTFSSAHATVIGEMPRMYINYTVTSTTPPSFSNQVMNATAHKNDSISFNITVTDLNADKSWFRWNSTGAYANDTQVSYTSGVAINTTKRVNNSRGSYICWQYGASNTFGITNTSDLSCFTVENSNPTNPTIIKPINGQANTSISFLYSSTDMDGDSLVYNIFINDVINYSMTSSTEINNWTASDGTYTLKISAYDGFNWSQNSSVTFTLDSSYPMLTSNISLNTTVGYDFIAYRHIFSDNIKLFRVNITSPGGVNFSADNINVTSYTYDGILNLTSLDIGTYAQTNYYCDAHTSNKIGNYDISKGFFKKDLSFYFNRDLFYYDEVKITPKNAGDIDKVEYTKFVDRYKMNFIKKANSKDVEEPFIVTSSQKIYTISDSRYEGWLVIPALNKWIDFNTENKDKARVERVSDNEVIVYSKGEYFNSIGDLNCGETVYKYAKHGRSIEFTSNVVEATTAIIKLRLNITSVNISNSFGNLNYDGVNYLPVKTQSSNEINYTVNLIVPSISAFTTKSFYFNYSLNGNPFTTESNSQNIYKVDFGNCTNSSYFNIISFHGRDEETTNNVTMNLSIHFDLIANNQSIVLPASYSLNGSVRYDFCVYPNITNYSINAIMEYGGGDYSNRKYHLVNYVLNASVHNDVYLYHLMQSKSSDIVFTVSDKNTGDKLEGTYIKILRYYPETNVENVVEIERTDSNGMALGKMVLADVFYKYIVEYPAGYIRLSTNVEKVLSYTKTFSISIRGDSLHEWDTVNGISTDIGCDKDSKTCSFEWVDLNNVAQSGKLRVFSTSGFGRTLLYDGSFEGSASTLSYTITEDTTGKTYEAEAFIYASDGKTIYPKGQDSMSFNENPLTAQQSDKIGALFPFLLLAICLVFALVDVGAIGVIISSIIVLIIGYVTGILPMSIGYLVSFGIMGLIVIYKISR